jgi:hypothetical protein
LVSNPAKSAVPELIKILSRVFQWEVVGSNQSPITDSDVPEHLVGGASYGQRRIAHFDLLIHSWFIRSIYEREAVMGYLNMWLLLFGSPSILILISLVGVHTWENAKSSGQTWSAKNHE